MFYQKIQPYFDEGILRMVYEAECLVIFAFGEICYIACPFVMVNNEPSGLYVSSKVIRELVSNNRYIFPLMKKIFGDIQKYQSLFYNFPEDKIDIWKVWIKDDCNISDIAKN